MPLTRKSLIVFDTEILEDNKVRVTVEMNDKYNATFDWKLGNIEGQTGDQSAMTMGLMGAAMKSSEPIRLYVGAKFVHSGWSVKIE